MTLMNKWMTLMNKRMTLMNKWMTLMNKCMFEYMNALRSIQAAITLHTDEQNKWMNKWI